MLIFQILGNADYVFTSIFTLEIILKVTRAAKPPLSVLCPFPLVSFTQTLLSSLKLEEFVPLTLCLVRSVGLMLAGHHPPPTASGSHACPGLEPSFPPPAQRRCHTNNTSGKAQGPPGVTLPVPIGGLLSAQACVGVITGPRPVSQPRAWDRPCRHL